MRAFLVWHLNFILFCALLGLLAGIVGALTGVDLSIGHEIPAVMPAEKFRLPTSNTLLLTLMSGLLATHISIRKRGAGMKSGEQRSN